MTANAKLWLAVSFPTRSACTRFVDDATFRATIGVTLNWNSPFGPIRFDIGRAVASEDYDDAKFFRFSGGTRF